MLRRLWQGYAPKTRRSGGVRVTVEVYRLIQRGNVAREAARWRDAADAFSAALAIDPGLHHIRIQLGHMLKQDGLLDEADAAYAEAARHCPDDAEPFIHWAAIAKYRHDPRRATTLLIAALGCAKGADGAERELRAMLDIDPALSSDALRSLIGEARSTPPAAAPGISPPGGNRPLVFDLTDLMGHFRYQRAPTGIQRVQIEVLAAALNDAAAAVPTLGCFVSGRSVMLPIPIALFRPLATLAGQADAVAEVAWQQARARLFLHLALADPLDMPFRAVLVNLGTSLWVGDYFLFVRNAKERRRISYVPFVHDLIPVTVPNYCVPGMKGEFAGWLAGLFQHADGFLANSRSTARDLLTMAGRLGREVAPDRVRIIPLDADFRSADAPLPDAALDRWGLGDADYVLMVSTIEPRKNHLLALRTWAALIRRHGAARIPRLVCVGRDGWLNEPVFALLAADPALIAQVTIIHGASDAELALLYRRCRFTVYPSHYEGWGLPVTEALCHGKLPVVADNSSLPEAGAGFALLFDAASLPSMVAAVERALFDTGWRQAQEQRIATDFRPRSWRLIAEQLLDAVRDLTADREAMPVVGEARLGAYHPVTLHRMPEIWPGLVGGEIFRSGEGWLWPETRGCRLLPEGGTLRLRPVGPDGSAPTVGPLRLFLRLRGLTTLDCPVKVRVGEEGVEAVVPARRTVWIACDVPPDPVLTIRIRGLRSEDAPVAIGGTGGVEAASLTVVGLLLGDPSDPASDAALESIGGWRTEDA